MRKSIIALVIALTGCSYTKPMTIAPMQMGPKEHPRALGRGESSASYLFGFRLEGDDSFERAVLDARDKSKIPHSTMANVFVDRHLFCFPACWLPIYSESNTTIWGTIITYDQEKPE